MDSLNHRSPTPPHEPLASWLDESVVVPPSLLNNVLKHVGQLPQATAVADLPQLLEALHDPSWQVRTDAILRLADLHQPLSPETLQSVLQDEHVSVRAAVMYALGQSPSALATPLLLKALQDPEWQVREQALLAIPKHPVSIDQLQACLYDPDRNVQEAARYAITSMDAAATQLAIDHKVEVRPSSVSENQSIKNVCMKKPFYRFWFSSQKHAYPSGENTMQQTHIPDRSLPDYRPAPQTRKSHRLAVGLVCAIAVALALIGTIIIPLTRLPGTGGLHHHNATPVTQSSTPTPMPSPTSTQIPLGAPGTTLYTYHSTFRSVFSASLSPDNTRMAIVDNAVKSMDTLTGNNPIVYKASNSDVTGMTVEIASVVWSPDSTRIAGFGQTATIWNATTGQQIATYQPPTLSGKTPRVGYDEITHSAWSPDSKFIASAANGDAYGNTVQIWNPQTQQTVWTIPTNTSNASILALAWSPNGSYLAFVVNTRTNSEIQVWNVANRKLITHHSGSSFSWSPDSTQIASDTHLNQSDSTFGCSSDSIVLWNALTGQDSDHFQVITPGQSPLTCISLMAWSPDGASLAIYIGKGTEIWDLHTKQLSYTYTQQLRSPGDDQVHNILWTHDSRAVVTSFGNEGPGNVMVWVP